ncbi:hypothetical protein F7725_015371 [Dissostichus mawsoni]|uniref:Uncharacterized protein n=1 Tax=Dissostichus mawsoni TaxID=36200 RepID=A0A7J5YHC0_DISMA|nr:hypothetical protein F7725_015371 [Dissostichus mawsoni]
MLTEGPVVGVSIGTTPHGDRDAAAVGTGFCCQRCTVGGELLQAGEEAADGAVAVSPADQFTQTVRGGLNRVRGGLNRFRGGLNRVRGGLNWKWGQKVLRVTILCRVCFLFDLLHRKCYSRIPTSFSGWAWLIVIIFGHCRRITSAAELFPL